RAAGRYPWVAERYGALAPCAVRGRVALVGLSAGCSPWQGNMRLQAFRDAIRTLPHSVPSTAPLLQACCATDITQAGAAEALRWTDASATSLLPRSVPCANSYTGAARTPCAKNCPPGF